ncbi:tRNA 2-thiouridine(34) synthase MnmA [bacterium]|nr:tRNA 2-thiouridine(34) synthase MnmA [bacterium]
MNRLHRIPKETCIAVAMSGGVDSSTTAAWLYDQGYKNIFGMTMHVYPLVENGAVPESIAITDAKKVSDSLGIPHYVLNVSKQFHEEIITNFRDEYAAGRTPNPCIRCNKWIKFTAMLDFAREHGAQYIATGHYVKVEGDNPYYIRKAHDLSKDQSYFLSRLAQEQLSYILTPLGYVNKTETREIARRLNLFNADKAESQGICFVKNTTYDKFVREDAAVESPPGPIYDTNDKYLGEHHGLINYTVGQRRGFGLALGKPYYVVDIISDTNTLIIGDDSDLLRFGVKGSEFNWIYPESPCIDEPIKARIRYRHTESPGRIIAVDGSSVRFVFDIPQRAITPGQQLVFYRDDTVLGSAVIEGSFDAARVQASARE